MMNPRFATFLGEPQLWYFDLGDSLKIISCFEKPENENDTPDMPDYLKLNISGVEYITGYEVYARKFGYVNMRIPTSYPNIDLKDEEYHLPSDIQPGTPIDFKNLRPDNYYKGQDIEIYCRDPRLLALCNFIADVLWGTIPYKKIKNVINRIPTRETAIKYMNHNVYIWEEPLTVWEQRYAEETKPEYQKIQYKSGDITPYIEGEFE